MWNPAIAMIVRIPVFGIPDEDAGDDIPAPLPIVGYEVGVHVNLPEALVTPELEPARITPATPQFTLFGVATAFLKFDTEEDAEAAARAAGLWTDVPAG